MPKPNPVAILCGDIHLSSKPPAFRSNEVDWFASMRRGLDQMRHLSAELDVPILCAGDIFDNPRGPVDVVNFALDHIPPRMYAIPGQHDLPFHRYDALHEGAFGTLVKCKKINLVDPDVSLDLPGMVVFGFPWNATLKPAPKSKRYDGELLRIALVHKYVWLNARFCFPGASITSKWSTVSNSLQGYDLCVFGDNHKGFYSQKAGVFNCGTFFRRKSDELEYTPRMGVLYSDGVVESAFLDTSEDVYSKDAEEEMSCFSDPISQEFLRGFNQLGDDERLDFGEVLEQMLTEEREDVSTATLRILYEARKNQ